VKGGPLIVRVHLRFGEYRDTGQESLARRKQTRLAGAALVLLLAAVIVSRCIVAAEYGLNVTFPDDLDLGPLAIGENVSDPQSLFVDSDFGYRVYVRADRDRLGQWDPMLMAYVAGSEMSAPLMLFTEGQTYIVGMGDLLVADRPGPSPPREVTFRFVQRVGFGDRPAPEGKVYRILLTYTVVQDV
jgi:hypothetical protein